MRIGNFQTRPKSGWGMTEFGFASTEFGFHGMEFHFGRTEFGFAPTEFGFHGTGFPSSRRGCGGPAPGGAGKRSRKTRDGQTVPRSAGRVKGPPALGCEPKRDSSNRGFLVGSPGKARLIREGEAPGEPYLPWIIRPGIFGWGGASPFRVRGPGWNPTRN